MRTLVTTTILIAFYIVNTFSQNFPGVWHGKEKTPDDKEISFVFHFESNDNGFTSTMTVPTFDVSGIKPKAPTFKEGKLTIYIS